MRGQYFLVLTALIVSLVGFAAAAAPSGTLPSSQAAWIDLDLSATQPTMTTLAFEGEARVYRQTIDGDIYDADDMGDAYQGVNKYSKATGDSFVAQVETDLVTTITQSLQTAFPGATVSGVSANVDRTTLVAASGGAYDPPVRVTITGQVERSREDAGLSDLSDAAVDAALTAGATIGVDFALTSSDGFLTTYTIERPAALPAARWTGVNAGSGSSDGTTFSVAVDNHAGALASRAVSVSLVDPSVTAPDAEAVETSIEIRFDLSDGSGDVPLSAAITTTIGALSVADRFPDALPSNVALEFLSADGLRALRQSGAISDDEMAQATTDLVSEIRANFADAVGGDVEATGAFNVDDLALIPERPFDSEPPVHFIGTATAVHTLGDTASEDADLDLALAIGAAVSFDLTLPSDDTDAISYIVYAPEGAVYAGAEGAEIGPQHLRAFADVAPGEVATVTLTVQDPDAASYEDADASLNVFVDLKDLDITLGGISAGDMGALLVDIRVGADLRVFELTDDLRADLPKNVDVAYLSADALRLVVERDLVDLDKVEQQLLDTIAQQLGGILGGFATVEGGFDAISLDVARNAEGGATVMPVVFSATTSFSVNLNDAASGGSPTAAIALITQKLNLDFPRIEGLDTAYTVVLPKGLEAQAVEVRGGSAETTESDGRSAFTVTPDSDEASVVVTMAVTPAFVFAKFPAVVLGIMLVLLLIILLPVLLVVRMRRKKKAAAQE